jgi:hypothetical protein
MTPPDFQSIWNAAWPYLTIFVTVASALDAVIPQPAPGSHWLVARKVLSFVAINVGHASNGKQPDFVTWIVRIATPVLQAQGVIAPQPPAAAPSPQPAGFDPSRPAAAQMIAVLFLAAGLLSACSSTTSSDVSAAVAKADAVAAQAGESLPDLCLAVTAAHDAFLIASDLSPDVAAERESEAQVIAALTTGAGICSPASLANPPANAVALVRAAVAQVRAFIVGSAAITPAPAPK